MITMNERQAVKRLNGFIKKIQLVVQLRDGNWAREKVEWEGCRPQGYEQIPERTRHGNDDCYFSSSLNRALKTHQDPFHPYCQSLPLCLSVGHSGRKGASEDKRTRICVNQQCPQVHQAVLLHSLHCNSILRNQDTGPELQLSSSVQGDATGIT